MVYLLKIDFFGGLGTVKDSGWFPRHGLKPWQGKLGHSCHPPTREIPSKLKNVECFPECTLTFFTPCNIAIPHIIQ